MVSVMYRPNGNRMATNIAITAADALRFLDERRAYTPRHGRAHPRLAGRHAGPRAVLGLPGRGELHRRAAPDLRGPRLELRLPRVRRREAGRVPDDVRRRD